MARSGSKLTRLIALPVTSHAVCVDKPQGQLFVVGLWHLTVTKMTDMLMQSWVEPIGVCYILDFAAYLQPVSRNDSDSRSSAWHPDRPPRTSTARGIKQVVHFEVLSTNWFKLVWLTSWESCWKQPQWYVKPGVMFVCITSFILFIIILTGKTDIGASSLHFSFGSTISGNKVSVSNEDWNDKNIIHLSSRNVSFTMLKPFCPPSRSNYHFVWNVTENWKVNRKRPAEGSLGQVQSLSLELMVTWWTPSEFEIAEGSAVSLGKDHLKALQDHFIFITLNLIIAVREQQSIPI